MTIETWCSFIFIASLDVGLVLVIFVYQAFLVWSLGLGLWWNKLGVGWVELEFVMLKLFEDFDFPLKCWFDYFVFELLFMDGWNKIFKVWNFNIFLDLGCKWKLVNCYLCVNKLWTEGRGIWREFLVGFINGVWVMLNFWLVLVANRLGLDFYIYIFFGLME